MKLLLIFLLSILVSSYFSFSIYPIHSKKTKKINVEITGCVDYPGEYTFDAYTPIEDLFQKAKVQEDCDITMYKMNLPLKDGDQVFLTRKNDKTKISINSASLNELILLPGIGESTAKNIIDYRNNKGFFQSIDEIQNVKGIGEMKFQKIKEYICL